jgi:short-subunit dehydrogenase
VRAVVIGGSAGLGRALCEGIAARGGDLLIVASDIRDLEILKKHLCLKYSVDVEVMPGDAGDIPGFMQDFRAALSEFGAFDSLFFPIGYSSKEDTGVLDSQAAARIMDTNFSVVMAVVSECIPGLMGEESSHIVGFGSIAAIRGRSANIVYSAAKRALASYFESLRHKLAGTNTVVQFYILGYVATQQAYGQGLLLPAADPHKVARHVLANLGRQSRQSHYPGYWAIVSLILNCIPWKIYERLKF